MDGTRRPRRVEVRTSRCVFILILILENHEDGRSLEQLVTWYGGGKRNEEGKKSQALILSSRVETTHVRRCEF